MARHLQHRLLALLLASIYLLTSAPSLAQTPVPTITPREQVITQIQEHAKQQVDLDLPPNAGEAVAIFGDDSAGLSSAHLRLASCNTLHTGC